MSFLLNRFVLNVYVLLKIHLRNAIQVCLWIVKTEHLTVTIRQSMVNLLMQVNTGGNDGYLTAVTAAATIHVLREQRRNETSAKR